MNRRKLPRNLQRIAPIPLATLPSTDYCPTCYIAAPQPFRMVPTMASEEWPTATGYVAQYRCDKGHTWTTPWDADQRMTAFAITRQILTAPVKRQ